VNICVICAFPERCEAEAVCPFEKNRPTEQQIVARENRANKDRLQERAIRSLEDVLRRITRFPRAITRHGKLRRRAPLSAASGGKRCRRSDYQSDRFDAEILF
jgi:hypothetical protein